MDIVPLSVVRAMLVGLALVVVASGTPADSATMDPVLEVTGLDDNAIIKNTITLTVVTDGQARVIFAFSIPLPWVNGTSYAWGAWPIRGSKGLRIRLDTRFFPEGPQAVMFFTRDASGNLRAMRAVSIRVHNRSSTLEEPASHIEIEQPVHGAVLKGNTTIRLRRLETSAVARVDYRVYRLGERWIDWSFSLPDGYWDIRSAPSGVYVVDVFARNAVDEVIDRSAITVVIPPKLP